MSLHMERCSTATSGLYYRLDVLNRIVPMSQNTCSRVQSYQCWGWYLRNRQAPAKECPALDRIYRSYRSRVPNLGRFSIVQYLVTTSTHCYHCWFRLPARYISNHISTMQYCCSKRATRVTENAVIIWVYILQQILKLDRSLFRHVEGATQQTIWLEQSLQSSRGKSPPSLRYQSPRYCLFHPGFPDRLRQFGSMTLVQSRFGTFQRICELYTP